MCLESMYALGSGITENLSEPTLMFEGDAKMLPATAPFRNWLDPHRGSKAQ